jgi:hypothetical protein
MPPLPAANAEVPLGQDDLNLIFYPYPQARRKLKAGAILHFVRTAATPARFAFSVDGLAAKSVPTLLTLAFPDAAVLIPISVA